MPMVGPSTAGEGPGMAAIFGPGVTIHCVKVQGEKEINFTCGAFGFIRVVFHLMC